MFLFGCWPELICDNMFLLFYYNWGSSLSHLCFLMKPRTNFPEQLGSRSHSLDQALVNPNYNSQGQSVDGDVETDWARGNLSACRREYEWETSWFTQQNTDDVINSGDRVFQKVEWGLGLKAVELLECCPRSFCHTPHHPGRQLLLLHRHRRWKVYFGRN